MTYNVVDKTHGVVQVDGEVLEIEGVMCGVADAEDHVSGKIIVTELRTGAKVGENIFRTLAIRSAASGIRSVEFGPAMVRTKTTLERMGISYPVNKV